MEYVRVAMTRRRKSDDQDRANSAVALAIFFTFHPCKGPFPDDPEAKVPLYLCGSCAKRYGITEEDLVQGVKIVTLPTLAGEMMKVRFFLNEPPGKT